VQGISNIDAHLIRPHIVNSAVITRWAYKNSHILRLFCLLPGVAMI
jgi:hypothetical protein